MRRVGGMRSRSMIATSTPKPAATNQITAGAA
jgi:hypothetical protein